MTVTVAAFADPTFGDRSLTPMREIGAKLGRQLLLGTAAIATIGVAVVSVTLPAVWLLSEVLSARHGEPAWASLGPREIAWVPLHPSVTRSPSPADIVVFPLSLSDATEPVHLAEHATAPRAPALPRPNSVPIPRVAPPALGSLRTAQRLASLPPAPDLGAALPSHTNRLAPLRTPDSHTAVYDISARAVYLPNGKTLEAHSGLGDLRDDPRYVRVKRRGPTPPNTYDLSLRGHVFHGVRAIRLTPVDEDKMFGRDGMLAHTYMLGPGGDSNGCVSFKDYSAFLRAYLRGDIDRLVVVAGNGAALAHAARGGDARYASSDPGPSSPLFSAVR